MSARKEEKAVVQAAEAQLVDEAPERSAVAEPAPTAAPALRPRLTPIAPKAAPLARLQAAAGQVVPHLRYQVMRLGAAGQAGLAALTAGIAVAVGALVPTYHALQSVNADLLRAQHPYAGSGIEQAVPRLVASLPTRAQMPAVLGAMFEQARSAGVPLDSGRYTFTDAKSGTIAHYDVEFPVKSAGYPEIRTFINRTLTAVPAASLEKLHVERKAVGDQSVSADISFIVFVRTGDAP